MTFYSFSFHYFSAFSDFPGPPQPGTRQAKAAHAISCLAVHLFLSPFCQKAAGVSKEKRAME